MVFGLLAVAGAVLGVVVAGAGLVAGAAVVTGVVPVAGPFPTGVPLTVPEVGVPAGVAVGSVVIGLGTGGKGFAKMPAMMSVRPASD